ncbi:MAG: tyrosine-type recombinase/integrase [Rudaea sp.]|nr:tyrosine-type recombinase/integrase [Rudaea sp.]
MTASNVIHLRGHALRLVPLENAVADWLSHIHLRGAARNTTRAYAVDLKSALDYFEQDRITVVALIGESAIERWLASLSRAGISPRSQARRLSAVKSFLRFCHREHWIEHDPSRDVHVRFRPRQVIAPEMSELMRMLDAIPRGSGSTRTDRRDYALLRLTLDTGIRASEVIGLDVPGGDARYTVDFKRLEVRVLGKGDIEGVVPFNEATARALEAWLRVRHAEDGCNAMFISNRGQRLTRQTVHAMIRKRGEAVGLQRMHIHLLRHRRIGDITERLGLKIAQGMARHASPATTAAVYGAHAQNVVHRTVRDHADLDKIGAQA